MKSRGLEALELLGNETVVVKNIKTIFMEGTNDDAYSYLTLTQVKNINQGCYETIEKELKALEILKEKRVNIGCFYHVVFVLKKDYESCKLNNNNIMYNICDTEKEFLTQEEFDSLKEVFCND